MPNVRTTAAIARSADRGRALFVPSERTAAARLLDELHRAALLHGVAPAQWAGVADLPQACLDVLAGRHRPRMPRTLQHATVLLDEVATELRGNGIGGHRDELLVHLGRTDTTPAWGPDGTAQLAISVNADVGWHFTLYGPPRPPVVTVYAPFSAAGAREVADLAIDVNDGTAPSPFRLT